MWIKIIVTLVVFIVALLTYVVFKPSEYAISRGIVINAPVAKVFPYINQRTLVNAWNPWFKIDPAAKIATNGPEEGVGSKTSWESGKQLGTGSAVVTEVIPNEKVVYKLDYKKPFESTQDASYILKSQGNQTQVTWRVSGNNTFLPRLMCLFMNMDKMVGETFSKGLADLKNTIENQPTK